MDEVLRLFRDATGYDYDGNTYDLGGVSEYDEGESDIELPIEQFDMSDSDSDESDDVLGPNTIDPIDQNIVGQWNNVTDVVVREFNEDSGPKHELEPDATPFDYFSLFIPENFYTMIVEQTNLYAEQCQQKAGKVDKAWKPATVAEIKLLLHIYITMGIHILPEYTDYWAYDDRLQVPGIASCMSKSRYEKLSQYLHLNDSSLNPPKGHESHDPLHKIRPFIELIRVNIATYFTPGKNISFDEAMIAFSGRLAFKQYIKGKPNPWGIKVWCAADSSTGYLLDFDVYTGKVKDDMPNGSGYYVVTKLGERFLNKYHHFFFDNYFSSIQLAQDLLAKETYCCSTIRPNRKGWPAELKLSVIKKMKKGDIQVRQNGNLVATAWKDKRCVTLLSTNTAPGTTTVSRRAPGGQFQVTLPKVVDVYNHSMGGVDKLDQLCAYYPVGRKSVKWWRYLFRFLLQVAIVNSWILYLNSHRPHPKMKTMTQKEYRLSLSSALLKGNISRKRKPASQPASQGLGNPDLLEHRLIRMVGNKRACHYCGIKKQFGKRKRAHETVYGCSLCQIRLCKGECYSKFHEEFIRT